MNPYWGYSPPPSMPVPPWIYNQTEDPVKQARRWKKFLKAEDKKNNGDNKKDDKKNDDKPKSKTFSVAEVFCLLTIMTMLAPLWAKMFKQYLIMMQ